MLRQVRLLSYLEGPGVDFMVLVMHPSATMQRRFGIYLKRLLDGKDYAQGPFAKRVGVSEGTLSNWIRGATNPDLEKVPEMCRALGLDDKTCEVLRILAELARSPTSVEDEFVRLKRQTGELEIDLPDPPPSGPVGEGPGSGGSGGFRRP